MAWPVTGPGNRQRAGRGTAWCLGQGLAQILQCQAGPSLHGDHQPHNCDTGQYQCSETRTVCVSLCGIAFTLSSINDTILNRHLITRRFYRQTLNIDEHIVNVKIGDLYRSRSLGPDGHHTPCLNILISENTLILTLCNVHFQYIIVFCPCLLTHE